MAAIYVMGGFLEKGEFRRHCPLCRVNPRYCGNPEGKHQAQAWVTSGKLGVGELPRQTPRAGPPVFGEAPRSSRLTPSLMFSSRNLVTRKGD